MAYLAQPISKRPDLQMCEASPPARHYHVCLSTACALGGTPSLVKEGEESFNTFQSVPKMMRNTMLFP